MTIEEHRAYMREYWRKRVVDLPKIGRCYVCGKKKPAGVETAKCPDCLKKAREYALKSQRKHMEEGLCRLCGKEPPKAGSTVCATCRKRQYEAEIIRRRNKRNAVQAG